jgi:hypothetical protein
MGLLDTFTSTGSKFFHHQQVMEKLRDGRGQPVTCHIMCTDICNHSCAFCSVQARAGDSLKFEEITGFVDILLRYNLKSVILSGGGNPILYKCKDSGANFNDVVNAIHQRGLEIGLITNGMPLRKYQYFGDNFPLPREDGSQKTPGFTFRESWGTVKPETLDKLTWIRISMSGLDHEEGEVYVPDIDPSKTTLGFSYVFHDEFTDPAEKHHGKVSRPLDLVGEPTKVRYAEDRIKDLLTQFTHYTNTYRPAYLRLLPNCLEPDKIAARCDLLKNMAGVVNTRVGREVAFVQHKPPRAPHACYLGYVHPVLNCDGHVYPCDSCVLNETAGHQFANPWRVCHWSEVARLYEGPVLSLIVDPAKTCPGCVFHKSNEVLQGVADGTIDPSQSCIPVDHANFV